MRTLKRLQSGGAFALGLVLLTGCASAQEYDLATSSPLEQKAEASAETKTPAPEVEPAYRMVTRHEMVANGERITYDAIAGETLLTDLTGDPTARIFSFTYKRTDVDDPNRPVLFIFNGGPGSASLWIHMGAIGPRRVVLDAEVNPAGVPPSGWSPIPTASLTLPTSSLSTRSERGSAGRRMVSIQSVSGASMKMQSR